MIDDTDRKILKILQTDARASNADVARQVGMSQSATLERLRRLEERGVVTGYEVRIEPGAVGRSLLAFVLVRSDEPVTDVDTAVALAEYPEVLEVHHVAGEDCYLLKVRAADTRDLARILRRRIGKIGSVHSTRSIIVLETVKETGQLPLPASREPA